MELLAPFVGTAPATTFLLVAMVLASLLGLYGPPAIILHNLFRPHWLLPHREYWTPVTSAFLHADLPHLLFNTVTFWAFSSPLEIIIGTPKILGLYFFGLLMSTLASYVRHCSKPDYSCLGASGPILSVMFGSIVYIPSTPIFIFMIPGGVPAPLFAFVYLAYSYFASRRSPGQINHDAHFSGALAGILFVALADPSMVRRAWDVLIY